MHPEPAAILVTGASGFVGRHLTAALAAHGGRVRAASRRTRPADGSGAVEWITVGSIGSQTDWSAALRGVVTVVHLGALAHRTDPRRQPDEREFMEVNAAGTGRLAEAAVRSGNVRRFVFVSSIGAVAETSDDVVDEATPPRPVSPYGRSKLAGERALRSALGGSSTEWCVLRPVLAYGPGNPGNMARLLKLVRTGVPLPLGGIRNRRSFVFVGSLVDAIERAAAPGAAGGVFNVADDEAVSTPELIRLVAAAAGRKARLWTAPRWSLGLAAGCGDAASALGIRTGVDSYSLRRLEESLEVSNRALRAATGWRPGATLADGLRLTLSRS